MASGPGHHAGTLSWGAVYGHSWFQDPAAELSVVGLTNINLEGCRLIPRRRSGIDLRLTDLRLKSRARMHPDGAFTLNGCRSGSSERHRRLAPLLYRWRYKCATHCDKGFGSFSHLGQPSKPALTPRHSFRYVDFI